MIPQNEITNFLVTETVFRSDLFDKPNKFGLRLQNFRTQKVNSLFLFSNIQQLPTVMYQIQSFAKLFSKRGRWEIVASLLIGAVLLGVRFLPRANSELIPFREKRLALLGRSQNIEKWRQRTLSEEGIYMDPNPLVSVSQYDGGGRRLMDDGTYDMDIDVRLGRE